MANLSEYNRNQIEAAAPRRRRIVAYRQSNMTVADIARIEGITDGRVSQILERARKLGELDTPKHERAR